MSKFDSLFDEYMKDAIDHYATKDEAMLSVAALKNLIYEIRHNKNKLDYIEYEDKDLLNLFNIIDRLSKYFDKGNGLVAKFFMQGVESNFNDDLIRNSLLYYIKKAFSETGLSKQDYLEIDKFRECEELLLKIYERAKRIFENNPNERMVLYFSKEDDSVIKLFSSLGHDIKTQAKKFETNNPEWKQKYIKTYNLSLNSINLLSTLMTNCVAVIKFIDDFKNIVRRFNYVNYIIWDHIRQRSKFIELLKQNNINEIYHITPIENMKSIQNLGALLAKKALMKKNINVNFATNDTSHDLDKWKRLDNYVHFSFSKPQNNPNLTRFLQRNNTAFAIFKFKVEDLAKYDNVCFSDINAASSNAEIFDDFENFSNLDFESIMSEDECVYGSKEYGARQAEILIPHCVNLADLSVKEYTMNYAVFKELGDISNEKD